MFWTLLPLVTASRLSTFNRTRSNPLEDSSPRQNREPPRANYAPGNHHQPGQPATGANPQPDGGDTEPGRNTAHGTPSPTASARDPQDPEPEADRQTEPGTNPDGHAPAGNESHTPPAAATARTQAADRRANAARPDPNRPDDTENTRAPGNRDRTRASTPRAQPTSTAAPGRTQLTAEPTAASDTRDGAREPEKPTTGADRTRDTKNDQPPPERHTEPETPAAQANETEEKGEQTTAKTPNTTAPSHPLLGLSFCGIPLSRAAEWERFATQKTNRA